MTGELTVFTETALLLAVVPCVYPLLEPEPSHWKRVSLCHTCAISIFKVKQHVLCDIHEEGYTGSDETNNSDQNPTLGTVEPCE
jgi:hypothetical protein